MPVKGHPLHDLAWFPDVYFIQNIETKLPIKKLWVTAAALSLSSSSTVEYSSLLGTLFFLAIQLKFSLTWLPPITPNYRLIKPLDYWEPFSSLPSPTSTFLQRFPEPSTRLYWINSDPNPQVYSMELRFRVWGCMFKGRSLLSFILSTLSLKKYPIKAGWAESCVEQSEKHRSEMWKVIACHTSVKGNALQN